MGAWGYKPFDNDDASDFWHDIRHAKNPIKELKKQLNNVSGGYENSRRAAAAFVEFLAKFDRRTLSVLKKDARKAIKDLLRDESFVSDWNEPNTVKRLLRKELKDLK